MDHRHEAERQAWRIRGVAIRTWDAGTDAIGIVALALIGMSLADPAFTPTARTRPHPAIVAERRPSERDFHLAGRDDRRRNGRRCASRIRAASCRSSRRTRVVTWAAEPSTWPKKLVGFGGIFATVLPHARRHRASSDREPASCRRS